MWVRGVAELATVREKQFHACENSEIEMKTEIVLIQASMYQNDDKRPLKSITQCPYEEKHKNRQKCNTSHGKWAYPKTTKLNVPTTPRCDVGCQGYKVDVRNELCASD